MLQSQRTLAGTPGVPLLAVKSTIFKAQLRVDDMDRKYFHAHSLTLARHPSETDERMMVRLLAFALHADEALQFAGGLSCDEPDLWRRDLTGAIELWIAVGQPDEQQIRTLAQDGYNLVVGMANWRSGEYVPLNEADLRRTIALCHKYGMKIIPYNNKTFNLIFNFLQSAVLTTNNLPLMSNSSFFL